MMRRLGYVLVGVVIASCCGLVGGAVVVALIGTGVLSEHRPSTVASGAPTPSVVTVERRPVERTVDGTLVAVTTTAWPVRADGVVTRPGARRGSRVTPGAVIAVVGERPIIVLRGAIPNYRSLVPGSEGADVRQLQRTLADLNYVIEQTGKYDTATARAVAKVFRNRGFDPVSATGAMLDHDADNQTAFRSAEYVVIPEDSAVVDRDCGTRAENIAGILCLLQPVVPKLRLQIPAGQTQVRPGQAIRVGATKIGTVGAPAKAADAESENGGTPTSTPSDRADGPQTLYESVIPESVRTKLAPGQQVTVVTAASKPGSLSVPAAAIREDARGTWLQPQGGSRLDVSAGLCEGGRCEVSGAGLTPGLVVEVLPG